MFLDYFIHSFLEKNLLIRSFYRFKVLNNFCHQYSIFSFISHPISFFSKYLNVNLINNYRQGFEYSYYSNLHTIKPILAMFFNHKSHV